MASTTDLGKWMLTNGGEYNPETAYEQLTMVMYENSTYITLKTVQGITPTDDHINYQLMAKGFNPTALESVQAEDTSGVLGEVGGTVSAQDLINWVVDQAATKLLKISDLVSVQTNDATKGVSAALAYAMGQKLDQLNSNFVGKFVTDIPVMTIHGSKGCTYDTTLVISSENAQSEGGHWKAHWIEGDGEAKRIGYVASTRAKYLLVWGVPILKKKDRELLENYGFISSEEVTNDVENEECT